VAAGRAIERLGLKVSEEREVVTVPMEDRPGSAAGILRRIGEAGINVELAYVAAGPRLVLGVSDPDKLRAIM
jgi:hypothetical protein